MSNAIGSKIDDYAKAHVKELKNEEAKTGKSLTKYDIAQLMLAKGALSEKDYGSWMNTSEGAESLKMSTAQKQALQRGNIWGFSGNNQPSYLETLSETDPFGIDFSNKKFDYKEVDAKSRIRALPQVEMSYTELTNSIKFKKMSREEKTEFLLQETGRMFYEAKEKGDKETMKATLLQGLGLTFAYMDEKAGITDVKEFLKEYSGLNAVVDLIDKYVEDGDDANLTFGERAWSAVKGAGDAVDGFIGTQAVAFVGTLSAASAAAASAGIGQIFSAVTTLGFGVQGATMMVEGGAGIVTGDTAEEVRAAGAEFTMGTIMFTGAAKAAKEGYNNYKAAKNAHAEQVANARKSLGIEDGVELNAQNLKEAFRSASLKNHPDKGGSADAMAEINNAYKILKSEIGKAPKVAPNNTQVEFVTKISEIKDVSGKPIITKLEALELYGQCKTSGDAFTGKPIPNFEARIEAVLNNPEEVASIISSKNKVWSIYRAIQDPYESTIKANPAVFSKNLKEQTNASIIEEWEQSIHNSVLEANAFIEKFNSAKSVNDLDLLIREAGIEELNFIINELSQKDLTVNKTSIENLLEDANNKLKILEGSSPLTINTQYANGVTKTKVYNNEGNLIEETYTNKYGKVINSFKFDKNGDIIAN